MAVVRRQEILRLRGHLSLLDNAGQKIHRPLRVRRGGKDGALIAFQHFEP